ncbi:MAG: dihydrofolate reductase family protein [Chloroflexi bacterium]|nr:dihydrofolate reductase family protein [Chloroflexota bacterium]
MSRVSVALAMSLDGYIAGPHDGAANPLGDGGMRLFDWYFDGDTPSRFFAGAARRGVPVPEFRLSRSSARVFDEGIEQCGAVMTGRRTYDITSGWGGHGPVPGVPLFILTHQRPAEVPRGESHYTFVTDGVESAVAQAKAVAGERDVSVMGSAVPRQCLQAGLLDEIQVALVPVLLGGGVTPFGQLGTPSIELERVHVIEAPGVTHLRFRVLKP